MPIRQSALQPDLALQQQRLIIDEDYGNMIAMVNGKTKRVPLGRSRRQIKDGRSGLPDDKRGKTYRHQLWRLEFKMIQ